MQSNEITSLLKNPDFLREIEVYSNEEPDQLALKLAKAGIEHRTKLTQILQLYRKAQHKLPTWVEHKLALTKRSYEQSSSEACAKFKAGLVKGKTIADLTCGLGVDSYYFAQEFENVIAFEHNAETAEVTRFNMEKLGIQNITINPKKFKGLSELKPDVIYVDPDRRTNSDSQGRNIEQYEPNILEHLEQWLAISGTVMIKLSPVTDITWIRNNIPQCSDIFVVSVKNEIKEILVLAVKDAAEITLHAVDINDHRIAQFSSSQSPAKSTSNTSSSKYLFEPGRAVIKSGLESAFLSHRGLKAINDSGTLAWVEKGEIELGRIFNIIDQAPSNKKSIKSLLKRHNVNRAEIICRNYFEQSKVVRKKLRLASGGNKFLIFTVIENSGVCFLADDLLLV